MEWRRVSVGQSHHYDHRHDVTRTSHAKSARHQNRFLFEYLSMVSVKSSHPFTDHHKAPPRLQSAATLQDTHTAQIGGGGMSPPSTTYYSPHLSSASQYPPLAPSAPRVAGGGRPLPFAIGLPISPSPIAAPPPRTPGAGVTSSASHLTREPRTRK